MPACFGLHGAYYHNNRGRQMASTTDGLSTMSAALPAVPLTLEGSSVLHQMFRFRWTEWRKLDGKGKREIAAEAAETLARLEQAVEGQSALFSMLGHKGDLLFIHFRNSFEQLKATELQISNLRINEFFDF